MSSVITNTPSQKLKLQFSKLTVLFFLLGSSLLLTGCSLFSDKEEIENQVITVNLETNQEWVDHQASVTQLTQYSAKGNFAYISPDIRQSASFFWEQNDKNTYRLLLLNPLGKTVIAMNVTAEKSELIDDKGTSHIHSNPQLAIKELAQMDIPIDNLRLWMLGLPGDATDLVLNKDNLLETAVFVDPKTDNKWKIKYLAYNTDMTPSLPRNLEVEQDISGEPLKIKLKINSWNL